MIRISREPLVKIWESQTAHIQSPLSHRGGEEINLTNETLIVYPLTGSLLLIYFLKTKLMEIATSPNFLNFPKCLVRLVSCLLLL